MRIFKGYVFRINPTKTQEEFFLKTFGACRFVWNYILDTKNSAYSFGGTKINYAEMSRGLTIIKKIEGLEWLNELNAQSLGQEVRKLDCAFSRFFKKTSDFPKFKKKNEKQSFAVPQGFIYKDGGLKIPKLKSKIKVIQHREFGKNSTIKSLVISKNKAGKYFCSFLVEEDKIAKAPKTDKRIGIDLGLTDLMVFSDGAKIKNPKIAKKYRKRLEYQHRQLSKKIKGSKGRENARIKLAKTYDKISRIKGDYTHKLTSLIINENQVIVMEDLSVANMMKNHKLARAIQDVSWGEIARQLEYKAKWNDRQFIKIDRFFPSSKTCHVDGFVNKNMDLSVRNWACPKCGTNHDRDINAAKNILIQGINILNNSGCGMQSESKQKLVEPSRRVCLKKQRDIEVMKPEVVTYSCNDISKGDSV
jgi:putative transposase